MPKSDPTFSDEDILRIMTRNLTSIERDYVICSILVATGSLRQGSVRDLAGLLKDIFAGTVFQTVKAAVELVDLIVAGEKHYNPDF